MKSIFTASKIVFLFLSIALIGLTYLKIVDAKDFIVLCGSAFTYYFTKKAYDKEAK